MSPALSGSNLENRMPAVSLEVPYAGQRLTAQAGLVRQDWAATELPVTDTRLVSGPSAANVRIPAPSA